MTEFNYRLLSFKCLLLNFNHYNTLILQLSFLLSILNNNLVLSSLSGVPVTLTVSSSMALEALLNKGTQHFKDSSQSIASIR